jgi:hypothetical protein
MFLDTAFDSKGRTPFSYRQRALFRTHMPLPLLAALVALLAWIVLVFIYPLGPAGAVVHLLLGVAGALFVRWWALRA